MATDKTDPKNNELVAESLESDTDKKVIKESKPAAVMTGGLTQKIRKFTKRFSIYLVGFTLLLVLIGAAIIILYFVQKEANKTTINDSTLSADTLKQLSKSDVTVGDPKQVLKVQSSAVFDGQVLVKGSLDVAGTINVGGALSLPGITVSGESSFEDVNITKTLNIGGDATVQGQLAVKKGITSSGSGTFGGAVSTPQITTSKLQLLGDLVMTSHLIAGGPTPGRASGGGLGVGGTSSVSGSDTAGTVNFNTGGSPVSSCLITVNFTSKYSNTPRVVITPLNNASAALEYYVTRTTSSFSICTNNTPAPGTGYGFDYIVLG